MKITKKLSVVALIVLMLVSAFSTFAYADNFDINAFETPGKAGNVKNLVNNTAATVITAARIICVTIAIVILLVIAMKYMISAPGDRADIKKHAVHYVISAVILFGATGVLTIISKFAEAFN